MASDAYMRLMSKRLESAVNGRHAPHLTLDFASFYVKGLPLSWSAEGILIRRVSARTEPAYLFVSAESLNGVELIESPQQMEEPRFELPRDELSVHFILGLCQRLGCIAEFDIDVRTDSTRISRGVIKDFDEEYILIDDYSRYLERSGGQLLRISTILTIGFDPDLMPLE